MPRLTATAQRNGVSEGIALGLLLAGRGQVHPNKVLIDGAFESAWRGWPHRDIFPQVSTDLRNGGSGMYMMSRADERKRTWVLFWGEWDMTIYGRQGNWDIEDPDDLAYAQRVIADGVLPVDAWLDLASRFLEHFDRHQPRSS